jgi:hypothetical protein
VTLEVVEFVVLAIFEFENDVRELLARRDVNLEALELHCDLPNRAALAAVQLATVTVVAVAVITPAPPAVCITIRVPIAVTVTVTVAVTVAVAVAVAVTVVLIAASIDPGVITAIRNSAIHRRGVAVEVRIKALTIARAVSNTVVASLDPHPSDLTVARAERAIMPVESVVLVVLAVFKLDDHVREVFARHHVNFVALEVHRDRRDRPAAWAVQHAIVLIGVLPSLPVVAVAIRGRLATVVGLALDRRARKHF